jgi:hypothetical protein
VGEIADEICERRGDRAKAARRRGGGFGATAFTEKSSEKTWLGVDVLWFPGVAGVLVDGEVTCALAAESGDSNESFSLNMPAIGALNLLLFLVFSLFLQGRDPLF